MRIKLAWDRSTLKISFISYEYPPDTGGGGIGTYVKQASEMLAKRGHVVEVFSASPGTNRKEIENNVAIHRVRIAAENRGSFPVAIGKIFAERHKKIKFDVLEGPEYGAEARYALELVPDIPLVIKLHTPTFLVNQINYIRPDLKMIIRRFLGAIRRWEPPKSFVTLKYNPADDVEYMHALQADEIVAPSIAIKHVIEKIWVLDKNKFSVIPHPYTPSPALLNIPVETSANVVGFIGRLEMRKGVIDLMRAIPMVLRTHPETRFKFIGGYWPSPDQRFNMKQYIEHRLKRHRMSLEFLGPVNSENIPELIAGIDICVFPSLWENCPLVCLEAMSAGRGVIASNAGGMAELLSGGATGILVPPHSPKKIADALIRLLKNPLLRMEMGRKARHRVLTEYSEERIAFQQEASYLRAIERRRVLGVRSLVNS